MPSKLPLHYPLPGLLGCFSHQQDIADEIHQHFYLASWREASVLGRLGLVLKALYWPLNVLYASFFYTCRNGRIVTQRTGKPIWQQFVEQLGLGLRNAMHPRAYYAFELFQRSNRERVNGYLQRYETKKALYIYLKSSWRIPTTPANDKLQFEQYVLKHNLPTIRTVVAFAQGERIDDSGPVTLPEADLFVKPRRGRGGTDCMRYRFVGTGWQAANTRRTMTAAELIAHMKALSQKTACLIQARYRTHRDLADLAGDTLATVRVLTVADVNGEAEALHAAFRMPRNHDAIVDNFHAGGIAASVDFKTGELGAATDLGSSQTLGWVDQHPASGAPIRGRVLPHWQQVVDLATQAHCQAFRDRILVGWDIAITDDGPIIVEGNGGPDLDIIQRVCQVPLGNDRFGELMLDHLRGAAQQAAQTALVEKVA